jgi:hypothetical protein
MIERAEMWDVVSDTDVTYRVQFWDTHEEDRHGKRRMAVAIWRNSPVFPGCFSLLKRSHDFWPGLGVSCDGSEAALHAVELALFGLGGFEDESFSDSAVTWVSP